MGDCLLESLSDSHSALVLEPEPESGWERTVMRRPQRTLSGRLYECQWGVYERAQLGLALVESGHQALIHRWWQRGDTVVLTMDTSDWPSTLVGRLANKTEPLARRSAPYQNLYAGVLLVEGDGGKMRTGRPFVLDDSPLGLLDQPYNALF